jgi:inner membrane protein
VDNVTHTLAGLLVAEAVVQHRRKRGGTTPAFATAACWVSALANNLPDLDFIYAGITTGKLGYLLHHRGHTHTLAFVPIAALLVFGATVAIDRHRSASLSRADLGWLGGLAVLGPVLHLLLDLTNNYGVHPLWPLDDRWFYGDGIFIIEPYLIVCGIAGLVFGLRRSWGRIVLGVIGAAVLTAVWGLGIVPHLAAATLTVFSAVLLVASRRLAPARRVALALGAWALVTATFFACGAAGRSTLARAMPGVAPRDVVMTPVPATPWCWSSLSIEADGDRYRVTRAMVAPFAGLLSADRCPALARGESTAPVTPVGRVSTPTVHFRDAFEGRRTRMRAVATGCRERALLRFARAPFWTAEVIGDLRYDREPGLGFAEIERAGPCPEHVPPWQPPRADVLCPSGRCE